jgi:dihydroxyacetone kinase-like predicted kinase
MKIRYLDGTRLYYAFLAGGEAVIRDQAYLNRINVFPVPDSDTGTNLASTMRAIAEQARASRSVRATLRSIADAALVGARGNSGLIFAQFLYGLSQEVREESRLTSGHFAEVVRRAVLYARRAILTPVEGTMLTVLHDWAEAVYAERLKKTDFAELLSHSLQAADRSLQDTPKKLAVLARAGVVDAGARGFFDFLEGVAGFIKKGSIKTVRP